MFTDIAESSIPVYPVDEAGFEQWLTGADRIIRDWVEATGYRARPASHLIVPGSSGGIECVLAGVEPGQYQWSLAHLPSVLPAGDFRLEADWSSDQRERALIGWALGGYRFDRYKAQELPGARMVRKDSETVRLDALVAGVTRVRDLVNTPAEDMGPGELADVAGEIARKHSADFSVVDGQKLEKEFPAVHMVGRAASRPPRLVRMQWGDPSHPPLALVGKGVIFDSGGLSIKPNSGMVLMKKDMGGAAHVLALAEIIMTLGLKVNLRVYVPAVENAISGNAYRPSDIIHTRKGSTIEVGNTDAEGRLILADALTLAGEEGAGRIVDFATLTGAARVALGPDLPPVYGRSQESARAIQDLSFEVEDPVWHMPLFEPYRSYITPALADISNTGSVPMGGSLTAALFLDHFVEPGIDWYHLDVYAWNRSDRPARPAGGEAQGLRAVWSWLEGEYGIA